MRVMARTMYKNQAGALAEYALAREFDTFPVPDALDDAQAAGFVVPYHTAHVGLVSRGKLTEGETLLVLGGSGASGSAAIHLGRSEEHTSELQSIMRLSYAGFCLKKKN